MLGALQAVCIRAGRVAGTRLSQATPGPTVNDSGRQPRSLINPPNLSPRVVHSTRGWLFLLSQRSWLFQLSQRSWLFQPAGFWTDRNWSNAAPPAGNAPQNDST